MFDTHFLGYDTIYSRLPHSSQELVKLYTYCQWWVQNSGQTAVNVSCPYSNYQEFRIAVLEWSVPIVSPWVGSVLARLIAKQRQECGYLHYCNYPFVPYVIHKVWLNVPLVLESRYKQIVNREKNGPRVWLLHQRYLFVPTIMHNLPLFLESTQVSRKMRIEPYCLISENNVTQLTMICV